MHPLNEDILQQEGTFKVIYLAQAPLVSEEET